MGKKQTFEQRLKNYWHNFPHKGFLLFQISIPIIVVSIAICLSFFSPAFAAIFFTTCCIGLWIVQLYLIKHYYGWKKFLFSLLSFCLWILIGRFIYKVKYMDYYCPPNYFCEHPIYINEEFKRIRLYAFLFYLGLYWAPIIPQYWRIKNHGRK